MQRKIALHLDYIYGSGTAHFWPLEELTFDLSKRTGRIKYVYSKEGLLATIRENGSLALTVLGAALLARSEGFKKGYCVTVSDEAAGPVSEGRSVFVKHIVKYGELIKPKLDVAVLDRKERVIAVGQSVISSRMMAELKKGVAVKVREGLKTSRMYD